MRQLTRKTPVLSAAAVLLAAALIPIAVAGQEKARPSRPAQSRLERSRPLADLNLTPDQVKALGAFRAARRGQARAFRDDMAKLRDEMRGLRADPEANQAKIEALIDKRAALLAAHEKDVFRARTERDRIFTPEQLEKLKAMRTRLAARGAAGRARIGRGHRLGLGWRRR